MALGRADVNQWSDFALQRAGAVVGRCIRLPQSPIQCVEDRALGGRHDDWGSVMATVGNWNGTDLILLNLARDRLEGAGHGLD
jgi:hypothetical protein